MALAAAVTNPGGSKAGQMIEMQCSEAEGEQGKQVPAFQQAVTSWHGAGGCHLLLCLAWLQQHFPELCTAANPSFHTS